VTATATAATEVEGRTEAAPQGSPPLTIAAEVALCAVTLTAFATFGRVFTDDAWRRPVLGAVVLAHLAGAIGRRLRLPVVVMAMVSAIGLVMTTSLIHYRDTLRAGLLPTGLTRTALDADLTAASSLFGEIGTPTATTVGFTVMIGAAVWLTAFLADWAAFRLWSTFEAIVPAFAVVIFVAFFAGPDNRLLASGLFVLAVLAFALTHRQARQSRSARWLANGQRAGSAAVLRAGAGLAVIATLLAVTLGPRAPGAEEEAIVDITEGGNSDPSRVVVSPLVDLRGRLVEQSNRVAFTVQTDRPSYYRLAGLGRFEDNVWGSQTSYEEADGPLPAELPAGTLTETVTQQFSILLLGQVWVPGAYEPRVLEDSTSDNIRYDERSGTLIVDRDLASSDGLRYTLISAVPQFDPNNLAASQPLTDPAIIEEFTSLPADFSPTARNLASEITAGLTSPYDQALALQNFFRDNFAYDINVAQGHSSRRVETFLAERRGYCEQFAGTFAAMARSLGLPARVAVGFTWGEQDALDPNLYRVRGEHAHAWPEVYFNDIGWVAFEPTPGRGAPGAAAWTGVEPDQSSQGSAQPPELPTTAPATAATPLPARPQEQAPAPIAPAADTSQGMPAWAWVLLLPTLAGLAGAGWLLLMRTLRARRFERRRIAAAGDTRRLVGVAWDEALDALRPLGVTETETETPQEFAQRVSSDKGLQGPELRDLGRAMTVATYGGRPPAPATAESAKLWADRIQQDTATRLTRRQRLLDLADPRPLVRR
jgi:transglutaminase-like putative cysteine protease